MRLVQYWHMTNVPPAIPMKKKDAKVPRQISAKPVQAVEMEAGTEHGGE
jgi:hypothetical protein